jgi:N6-adenosine-specific RNA methylase IME4
MALLYVSDDREIFLIDIPRSIAEAQGTSEAFSEKRLKAFKPPISEPWPDTEPKSDKAMANVRKRLVNSDVRWEEEIRDGVSRALKVVRQNHKGPWCESRLISPRPETDPSKFLSGFVKSLESNSATCFHSSSTDLSWKPWSNPSYMNTSRTSQVLNLKDKNEEVRWYIPPNSSFSLLSLPYVSPLPTPMSGFELIVLDPPWSNRSARRRGAYATTALKDVRDMLEKLHLERYLAPQNVTVAMWATNSTNSHALTKQFLEDLGLVVYEEWLWIKITDQGELVLPVDGVWRKPWETLYIGRASPNLSLVDSSESEVETNQTQFRRRFIFATPEEHSRKPCLQQIYEMVLNLPKDYIGLEVFARNLVAGWHSWGNEALLFNWEEYWTDHISNGSIENEC